MSRAPDEARLLSADVVTDLRAALMTFEEEARAVVDSVGAKSEATVRWLSEDAPRYWQTSQRQANDSVAAARIALERCRLRTVAGHRPSCIDEKVALRRSKERERFCTDQRVVTRSHATSMRQTVDELRAQIGLLERWLDAELPKLQARLHRTAGAVAAYAATPPVRTERRRTGDASTEDARAEDRSEADKAHRTGETR